MYRNTIKATNIEEAGKGKLARPTQAKTEKKETTTKTEVKDPLLKGIDDDMYELLT